MALVINNSPANAGNIRGTGSSLGQEDPLEQEIATHSSILSWRKKLGGLQSMGSQKAGHD